VTAWQSSAPPVGATHRTVRLGHRCASLTESISGLSVVQRQNKNQDTVCADDGHRSGARSNSGGTSRPWDTQGNAPLSSRKAFWAGWVLSLLPALVLMLSAGMNASAGTRLWWGPSSTSAGLSDPYCQLESLELACLLLFLIPRTAALGAILIAGYMGGAIATHARLGEPVFGQAAVGLLAWLGLYPT